MSMSGEYKATNEFIRVAVDSEGRLITVVECGVHLPRYAACPHNVLTAVWDPAAGYYICMTSALISVENAGLVELYRGATLFAILHFDKKSVAPVPLPSELTFAADEEFKAKFVSDTAVGNAHVTAAGHEHT